VSLALFAMAGIIFYWFRYYMVWDWGKSEFNWPKEVPRRVKIWIGIAIGLIIAGVIISPRPL